jgi:hypothetical protein
MKQGRAARFGRDTEKLVKSLRSPVIVGWSENGDIVVISPDTSRSVDDLVRTLGAAVVRLASELPNPPEG